MAARISVIVPHFNQPADLARCLDALAAQSLPPELVEIIVVDNHSRAGLRPSIDGRQGVRLVVEESKGSYAARNRGVRETTTSLLAFTDADCLPDSRWLEFGMRELEALEGAPGMVGGRIEMQRPGDDPTAAELYDYALGIRQAKFMREAHFAATANLLAHRALFDEVGFFNEKLMSGGDWEWGNRVHRAGFIQVYDEKTIVRHPLRTDLAAVLRKTRRTVGGVYTIRQADDSQPRPFFGASLRSARQTLAELAEDPVTRPASRRLKVVWVGALVTLARQLERLRLRCGGRPLRS